MDYDCKVACSDVALFLGDELKKIKVADFENTYNISDEYAKTKKNHNYKTWILLSLSVVLSILITLGVTLYVSYSNKKISIKIDSFDDLNLKGLLDMVSRTQMMYEEAARNKAFLEASLQSELKLVEQKRDNEFFTLKSMEKVCSKDEIAIRRKQITREYNKSVAALHSQYDVEIETAENQMKVYQQSLNEYDSNKIEQAKMEAAAINSQKQLYEMETQKLKAQYEQTIKELQQDLAAMQLKGAEEQRSAVDTVRKIYQARVDSLDPVFEDTYASEVIKETQTGSLNLFLPDNYVSSSDRKTLFTKRLATVQKDFEKFNYLSDLVQTIPWENDTLSYIQAMKVLSHKMCYEMTRTAQQLDLKVDYISNELSRTKTELDGYKKELDKANNKIERKQTLINSYGNFSEIMAREYNCDGFVLSVGKDGTVYSFISDKSMEYLKKGKQRAVIKEGRRIVAAVEVLYGAEYPIIAVLSSDPKYPVQCGQRIYLQIKK